MRGNIPITERSHIKTQDIDVASEQEIVEILKKCSWDIFTGWQDHQNVFSENLVKILDDVAILAVQFLKPGTEKSGIVLSGCGTSGRIAFLISRKFNQLAEAQKLRPCYRYIISGGDHAIMTSVESCEDDWNAGKKALESTAEGLDKVLYVGITCGLSAPFVGGQVEYCLQHPQRFTPYLLGFNPATQARNAAIGGTDKVMLDIALKMEGRVIKK
jgi:N-acetylmuramic acid 6-phosphate (MurNAc-6-P) etherase